MIRHKDYLMPVIAEGARNMNLNTPGYLAYQVGANWSYIKLPPGRWQIIGMAGDVTEEQKKEIVERWAKNIDTSYRNYEWPNGPHYFHTHSLAEKNTLIIKMIKP